ncbi:MAG TPA: hypothetical protein VHL11_13955, partial [Phototrophicaceae bacterium]|nr:hypothetical protein [Phototrophicaceae bacterium]
PGLLVTLAYDAAQIAIQATADNRNRTEVLEVLKTIDYPGINGQIRFKNGYWLNAPLHQYQYDQTGKLQAIN